ncbi:unnamed protein product [Cylicostephanus goldi]|uniref:Uncharacterized protein n=1 Tax=Cylicostephanus goldi TaxID=71465 RepID=A0A3P6TB58_CYLGO|nr:unnamed protein product [Cylicostephanus goldi]
MTELNLGHTGTRRQSYLTSAGAFFLYLGKNLSHSSRESQMTRGFSTSFGEPLSDLSKKYVREVRSKITQPISSTVRLHRHLIALFL